MTSHELLKLVLDAAPDAQIEDAVRAAVARKLPEDHVVDFKHGLLADDPEGLIETARRMVCGFANAEGGVMVLGVEDKADRAFQLAGVTRDDAVPALARGLAVLLAARPLVRQVTVDGHRVVLVGTPRSGVLLRFQLAGEQRCFLRIGESTYPVPMHLQMDLVLGRKERAAFDVRASASVVKGSNDEVELYWDFSIRNESLAWAEQVRVGILGYGDLFATNGRYNDTGPAVRLAEIIPSVGYIQAGSPASAHLVVRLDDVGPMDSPGFKLRARLRAPQGSRVWTAAVYVLAPNAEVQWYVAEAYFETRSPALQGVPTLERVWTARPLVFWGSRETWLNIERDRREAR